MPDTRTRDERIAAAISARLMTGTLPSTGVDRAWGGPGTGRPCEGCDEFTDQRDVEIEMETREGRMLVLHVNCFIEWFDLTRATRAHQAG